MVVLALSKCLICDTPPSVVHAFCTRVRFLLKSGFSSFILSSRKKAGASLPNTFLFSAKGSMDYDKLELAEFVCGFLEFYKSSQRPQKAPI